MNILLSILLSLILAIFALLKKAMTSSALLCAFLFSCIITYYGGLSSYFILVTVFLGTIIANKIGKNKRDRVNQKIIEKYHKKDIYQIIANVGVGTIIIIIYALTKNAIFLLIYASVMAESLADSLASDIGVLSQRKPINILTLKRGEPGLSGNISPLGLIASFLGSTIVGLVFIIFNYSLAYLIIITCSGFLGTLIDSLLGSSFQIKYRCSKCQKIIEQKEHCNTKTIYFQGIKIINNDMVNLMSNISAAIICYLLISIV